MALVKKIVKFARKKGYKAVWNDSDNKFDVHLVKDLEKPDTYVLTLDDLKKLKIKPAKLDPEYLYAKVTADVLVYSRGRNLIILFDEDGSALCVRKVTNINLGVYYKRQINKILTNNQPEMKALYTEVLNMKNAGVGF
ncbi:MAG: hypothetical protein QXV17_05625 [Candidatus Micrarchaeaceae archaeon]